MNTRRHEGDRDHAGCPSYWVVDPDEPSIIVWQLHGGEYVEMVRAAPRSEILWE